MDSIRKRQIDEVLNNDMEINKIVFQMQKRNVGLTTENVLPYTQMNSEVLDTVGTVVNQLFVILEKKKNDIFNYNNSVYHTNNQAKEVELFNEITSFEEVLRLYNTAVEPYSGVRSSLTQQTKGEILNKTRKLLTPIAYITNGIKLIVDKLIVKFRISQRRAVGNATRTTDEEFIKKTAFLEILSPLYAIT